MNKNSLSHNYTKKEKEHALSLFRIPLNFFADAKKENSTKTTHSAGEAPSDSTSNPTTAPEQKIKLDQNKPHESINLSLNETEAPLNVNPTTISSPSPISEPTSSPISNPSPNVEEATAEASSSSNSSEDGSKQSNTSTNATSSSNKATTSSTSPSVKTDTSASTNTSTKGVPTKSSKTPSGSPEAPNTTPPDDKNSQPENNSSPKSTNPDDEQGPDNTSAPEPSEENPSNTPKTDDSDNNGDNDNSRTENNPKPQKNKPNPKDSELNKELDRLKNKFIDTDKGKFRPLTDHITPGPIKPRLGTISGKLDKVAGGKLGKVNDIKNKINKYKNIGKEIADDPDKAAEAVGDAAVKAASYIPVYGKAIGAADKLVGNTEVGKKAKKTIGYCTGCCCAAGCLIPIMAILIVIMPIISLFSGIFGGGNKDGSFNTDEFIGYTEEELEVYKKLYEENLNFSLKNLISAVEFAENENKKLDEMLDRIMQNKDPKTGEDTSIIYYLEKDANAHNLLFKDYIEQGIVSYLEAGDLTDFGLTLEFLHDNYTISNLKMPSLAPERTRNGTTYVTFDPTGKHQALFEDALNHKNNPDKLKDRFFSVADPEWFDNNLTAVLDRKFDNVYVPRLDRKITLSLRDLFEEVSTTSYDTEYDVENVTEILYSPENTKEGENNDILDQFYTLQDNLVSLEMLTYMLHYQQYYRQKSNLIDKLKAKGCKQDNIDMYNDEFFGQFLSFSDIQEFIALSTLADHSLAYEIACVSLDSEMGFDDPIITFVKINGNTYGCIEKLTNWYATYNFETRVINDGVKDIEIRCIEPIEETEIKQKLFDKYNVEASARYKETNFYDEDPNDEQTKNNNATTFFSFFEFATGISITTGYDGTMRTPVYELSPNEINVYLGGSPIDPTEGRISFPFNAKYSPTTLKGFGISHENHTGIDYSCEIGTVVYAIADGTAYIHYGNTGWGNFVEIYDENNYRVIYAHGSGSFYVSDGQSVKKGDPIMRSGNSGNSTGPHLHLEVQNPSGVSIKPNDYNR